MSKAIKHHAKCDNEGHYYTEVDWYDYRDFDEEIEDWITVNVTVLECQHCHHQVEEEEEYWQ